MEPLIAIDCDGVLADFNTHLLALVESDRTPAHVHQYEVFDLLEIWHGRPARVAAIRHCDTADPFWSRLPMMPGAAEALAHLRAKGSVVCLTAPWMGLEAWETVRRQWLVRHYAFDPKDIVFCPAKYKPRFAADALIDDRTDVVLSWARRNRGGTAFLYDAPYNATVDLRGTRVTRIAWGPGGAEIRDRDPEAADFCDAGFARFFAA